MRVWYDQKTIEVLNRNLFFYHFDPCNWLRDHFPTIAAYL